MEHKVYQISDSGIKFVKKCIEILEARGLDEEGIYRLSGSSIKVDELICIGLENAASNKGDIFASPACKDLLSTKTLTGAIKQYLRYLGEPLMTRKYFYYFVKAASE